MDFGRVFAAILPDERPLEGMRSLFDGPLHLFTGLLHGVGRFASVDALESGA